MFFDQSDEIRRRVPGQSGFGKVRVRGDEVFRGGRCNFTNLYAGRKNFISANPHFAKSALARYTPADFIALGRKNIAFLTTKRHSDNYSAIARLTTLRTCLKPNARPQACKYFSGVLSRKSRARRSSLCGLMLASSTRRRSWLRQVDSRSRKWEPPRLATTWRANSD